MRSYLLSILIIALLSSFSSTTVMDRILNQNIPWELKASKNNLSIHHRWHRNVENDKTRQLLCSAPTNVDSEAIILALQDPNFSQKWLKRVSECRIIQSNSPDIWYTYLCFDFPWPMSKRDIVIQNRLVVKNNITVIELKGVNGIVPPSEDITRMKGFYGFWRLSEDNILEYSFYSDVKSKIPTWTTDPFIEQNLFECFGKFNAEVGSYQVSTNS